MSGSADAAASGASSGAPATSDRVNGQPRWYWHPYNRAALYRLGEALSWLPRGVRLGLARQLGRSAVRFLPAERQAIRTTLARMTGASGAQLQALTAGVFGDFAMCFS